MAQISTINNKHSKPFLSSAEVVRETPMDVMFQRVVLDDDLPAFEHIFNKTYKSLCQFSNRLVKNLELAEEIVDDVFYTFWKNRKTINIKTSFTAYLLASVRNRSLDSLRKTRQQDHILLEPITEHHQNGQTIAHDTLEYEQLQQRIDAAIHALPSQCRLIFLMSREQEFTYKEIAIKLGLSIKTIDTQMGRALKHLRLEMSDVLF
jgi:RNA polymerase sigma-70 factor (ECF subfamily)